MLPSVDSPRPQTAHIQSLPEPVAQFDALVRHAEALAPAASLPKHLRGSPADVLLVLRAAEDLRLPFTAAVSGLHIVEGKLAMSAELMRALCFSARHKFWFERSDDTGAVACIRRRGDDHVHRAEFTMEDARRAGLVGRDNWKRYPGAMCAARATSAVCRRAIPDVLAGVGHTPEELDPESDADVDMDAPGATVIDLTPEGESASPVRQSDPGPPSVAPQPASPERSAPGPTSEQWEQLEVLLDQLAPERRTEVVERMKQALRIDALGQLPASEADAAIRRLRLTVEAERPHDDEPAYQRLAFILGHATPDAVRHMRQRRGDATPATTEEQARFRAVATRAALRTDLTRAGLKALFGVETPAELSDVELTGLNDAIENEDALQRFADACAMALHHPVEVGT